MVAGSDSQVPQRGRRCRPSQFRVGEGPGLRRRSACVVRLIGQQDGAPFGTPTDLAVLGAVDDGDRRTPSVPPTRASPATGSSPCRGPPLFSSRR